MLLNKIGTSDAKSKTQPQSAQSMLLGCHERIRHFAQLSVKLSRDREAPAEAIRDAAQAIVKYFTVALPLHEADENESIAPRFRQLAAGTPDLTAAEAMVDQHRAIDERVQVLVPLCRNIAENADVLAQVAPQLEKVASELVVLFDAHLRLEEETVFPAIERLMSEDEVAELTREMQARRNK